MAKAPVRVAVTGAAGQIGYALLFRIASGQMLGNDQPIILQLLELPMEKAQQALKGVIMELEDCAFPLLIDIIGTSDPIVAFKDASKRCWSVPNPVAPAWNARICCWKTPRYSSSKAGRSTWLLPATSRWSCSATQPIPTR